MVIIMTRVYVEGFHFIRKFSAKFLLASDKTNFIASMFVDSVNILIYRCR